MVNNTDSEDSGKAPSLPTPARVLATDKDLRRLIILAVEPGLDVEVDWEGEWDFWELLAVLNRAADIIEDWWHETLDQDKEEDSSD